MFRAPNLPEKDDQSRVIVYYIMPIPLITKSGDAGTIPALLHKIDFEGYTTVVGAGFPRRKSKILNAHVAGSSVDRALYPYSQLT
jgi:hypothetical protein